MKEYWLTRLLLERGIALVCLVAFAVALNQFRPLLGERGLLPVPLFIKQVPFNESPSLFYWLPRDFAFTAVAWAGIILSLLVLTGIATRYTWPNVAVWAAIYLLYLSFVNVGQTFYAFGWESILLEAAFFAIFLGGSRAMPQAIPIWLFRWLLFRIMFGAGLIKLRGDSCWRDLTCLNYYYETQPMPNPLSWYFHWAPQWVNKGGVLFNHFSELIVPFFYFMPQPIAGIAGLITIAFQLSIIVSGNLSWLNWLTLVLAFSTLDAKFFSGIAAWAPALHPVSPAVPIVNYVLLAGVVVMSIPVVTNMLSARQIMNTNFNSLHLVGTYGAFGSITRTRYEVIVEGTDDAVITSGTRWREYEFKGKPGNVGYRPPKLRLIISASTGSCGLLPCRVIRITPGSSISSRNCSKTIELCRVCSAPTLSPASLPDLYARSSMNTTSLRRRSTKTMGYGGSALWPVTIFRPSHSITPDSGRS